jgi:hypothetical protein
MDRSTTPTLSELLEDPIILAVMARDGVSCENLRQLFDKIRHNRRIQEERIAA